MVTMLLSLLAVLCCGVAGFLAVPGNEATRRLTKILLAPPEVAAQRGKRDTHMRWAVGGLAGFVSGLLIGGVTGWTAGVLITVGCIRVLSRLEPRAVRQRRARIIAELPLTIDLLAACLRGGGAWHASVEAVAEAVGGPLGEALARVAARIRLGADPAQEWLNLADDPALAPLGRAAARAATGGAPVAATLARLARDQRRTARAAASARARTAGIRAVAPLGLCFLPAFIILGIVPAIAGMARNVLIP
ncbi:type II secretion system F family protein [Actinoallomurus oryzae]|uniref:Type II secretion system F family protein n=2 Tax=Actinoallomurus oryzae TaxID=502180 RepID=A0ABP8QPA7_9ACTN